MVRGMSDNNDVIGVRFRSEFEPGDVLKKVDDFAADINKKLKAGLKSLEKTDFVTSIVQGLRNVQTASQGVDQQAKKTGESLTRELKQAQQEAEKLSKIVKGMGKSYADSFVNANQFIDGLHLADFTDMLEALKRQFAFMEDKPLFAKQIAEAETINGLIAQLYETIAKVNAKGAVKIGLPELEAGLLAAFRETSDIAAKIVGTEQSHEAILAKNVALQAEQAAMMAKQHQELTDIEKLEAARSEATKKTLSVYDQMARLQRELYNLGDDDAVQSIADAMDRIMHLAADTKAIKTRQLMTEQQIVSANMQLMQVKNQILDITNKTGVSYDREVKAENEILRLYQMRQRQIAETTPMIEKMVALAENLGTMLLGQSTVTTNMQGMYGSNAFKEMGAFGQNVPAVINEIEGSLKNLYQTWGQITDSMKAQLHLPLQNELDVAKVKLEKLALQWEEIKQIGFSGYRPDWTSDGSSGAQGPPPPPGLGALTVPNPEPWDNFNASLVRLRLEANKLYQQLQEIATMKVVKGDEFDEMTAKVRAYDAEIDRAIKSLAKLNTHDISGTDKLGMEIASISMESQRLESQFSKLTAAEKALNIAFNEGKISGDAYNIKLQAIHGQMETLQGASRQLQEKLAGVFKDVQTEKIKAQLASVRNEYQALEKELQEFGKAGLDASARVQILQKQMALLKEEVRLNKGATEELNAAYRQKSTELKTTAKVVNESEGGLRKYGMRIRELVQWQLEWYAGAGLIWGAFFKIKDAIAEFLSYSQGLTDVGAITGATAAELKKMDVVARDVATHSTMGFQAAAESLKIMGQAGMTASESMSTLGTVSKMTTATGASATDTVKLLTTAMNVWSISADRSAEVGNAMAAALNYSKLEIGDLGVAFNYLAPQAKLAGYSLEQTLGMVAQLSQMGIKASTIGTGLSGFIGTLLAPTKKWQEALAKVHLSMKDLKDATGNLLPMVDIIRKLEKAGMDVGTVFEGLEQRQARALAEALVAGADGFKNMTDAVTGTNAMTVMFDKSMKGMKNELIQVGHQIMDILIGAFTTLTPAIQGTISVVSMLISGLREMGPLILTFVGALGGAALLKVTGVLAAINGELGIMATLLNLMKVHPVIMAISAVAALAVGIGYLKDKFDDVKQANDAYNESMAKSQEAYSNVAEIGKYVAMLKSESVTASVKNGLLEKFKQLAPGVIDSNMTMADVIKALKDEHSLLNKKLEETIMLQQIIAAQEAAPGIQKIIDQYGKLTGQIKDLEIQKSAGASNTEADAFGFNASGLDSEIEKAKRNLTKIDESWKGVINTVAKARGQVRLALLEKLNLSADMAKVLNEKVLEREAEEQIAKKPPLPGKTKDEKVKDYARSRIATAKKMANDLLAIDKVQESEAMHDLEQVHRLNLMSDTTYYEMKQMIAESFGERQLKTLKTGYDREMKIVDAHLAKLKVSPSKVKEYMDSQDPDAVPGLSEKQRLELEKKLELEKNYVKQVEQITRDSEKKIEDAKTAGILKSVQLTAEEQRHALEMLRLGLEEQYSARVDEVKQEEELNKYLHEHYRISDEEFLNRQKESVRKRLEIEKDQLAEIVYIEIQKEWIIIEGLKNNEDAKKAHYARVTELVKKYEGQVVKATRDASDQIVAINRQMPQSFAEGAAEGIAEYLKSLEENAAKGKSVALEMAKTIEDALVKAFDNPKDAIKDLGNYFMNMLKRMIVQALANPIIIPIQQMMMGARQSVQGWLGGAGGGSTMGSFGSQVGSWMNTPLANFGGTMNYTENANGLGWSESGYSGGFQPTPIGIMGAAAGMYGTYNAIKSGDPLSGAMSGMMTGASIGSMIPVIGPLAGAIVGLVVGAVGGMLGGGDDNLGLHFNPTGRGANYYAGDPLGSTATGAGWTHHNAGGGFFGITDNMGAAPWALALIQGFKTTSDSMRAVLDSFGLDTSGFDTEFQRNADWKAGKVTPEEMQATLEGWFGEWMTQATKIDFAQFQHSGEKLIDTINRIVTAVQKVQVFKALKIQDIFDSIDIHPNTAKEAVKKIDDAVNKSLDELPALTGAAWADKIGVIADQLTERLNAAVQYVTYIKTMQETIAENIKGQLKKYATDAMDLSGKIASYTQEIADSWSKMITESDPTKLERLTSMIAGAIDNLYNALMSLKDAVRAVGDAASTSLQDKRMELMTPEQRVNYVNEKATEAHDKYLTAKAKYDEQISTYNSGESTEDQKRAAFVKAQGFAGDMTKYGGQVNSWIEKGWGLEGVDKVKSFANFEAWQEGINADMTEIGTNIDTVIADKLIPGLEALGVTINDKLVAAIQIEVTAIDRLRERLESIDFQTVLQEPFQGVTPQATGGYFTRPTLIRNQLIGEAGPEYNIPEAKLISLIQQAVAGGGSGRPEITIVFEENSGALAKLKREAAEEGIRIIRRDPRVLR